MKVPKIADLQNYKKAKIIKSDLEKVLEIYELTIKTLENYKRYTPVQETLASMKNNRVTLNIFMRKCNKLIENKGTLPGGS